MLRVIASEKNVSGDPVVCLNSSEEFESKCHSSFLSFCCVDFMPEISGMPIYEYKLENDEQCSVCGGNFTLRRPLSAKPLTNCPLCKKAVKKLISGFNTPTITKPVSFSDAKKAGFTVLKKVGKGEYERQ
ncbi:zinc ribbon domain-containing protein [Verrucomicrobia bacterium]|nr:zinc ribbon domain-containing protein [Verrucomicrobiota bacterium]MDG1893184.1 zinc ribbon domain-containing protein [Verrucomicrobiota bacterium]